MAREQNAAAVRSKLESLYMTKSLANRLYLKQRLYAYKIKEDQSLEDQIEKFVKILDDLENIEIKLEEDDKALILLNALPRTYENFKDAILYGREQTITLEEVQSAIKTKQLQKKLSTGTEHSGEVLMTRGRPQKRTYKSNRERLRSKSQARLKCFICHKEGHFKRNCPNRNKRRQEKSGDDGETSVVSDGYESAEALVIVDEDSNTDWILDSGCSFHMCPNMSWFEELNEKDEGTIRKQ